MKIPIEIRFNAKVIKQAGCWDWLGGIGSSGYGQISVNRIMTGAHRVSWELHYGPIPNNLWVLHKCDNKKCTNPDHLFLGTVQDNVTDLIEKRGHFNSHKTHCKHGHELNNLNSRIQIRTPRRKERVCKLCQAARKLKWA